MGYSIRIRPGTTRTIARLLPSGPQSAHSISFRMSLGAAPPATESWASVPVLRNPPPTLRSSDTAMSPDFEIDRTSAPVRPKGRDSGLSGRPTKISIGLPSQAAEYMMVCPSGAKRAEKICPRRNVSWRKDGGGRLPALRTASIAQRPDEKSGHGDGTGKKRPGRPLARARKHRRTRRRSREPRKRLEVEGEVACREEPFLGILLEAVADDPLEAGLDAAVRRGQVWRLFSEDRGHRFRRRTAVEGARA